MPAPNEITAIQLLRTIGTAHAPLIVDLSIDEDHAAYPYLIPTARRHPHTDLHGLAELIGTRRAVLVCQKGRKISQGAAAWLASVGSHAEYLPRRCVVRSVLPGTGPILTGLPALG